MSEIELIDINNVQPVTENSNDILESIECINTIVADDVNDINEVSEPTLDDTIEPHLEPIINENTNIIDNLMEKQRLRLSKLTPEQLTKLSERRCTGRGSSTNKKYRYALNFYNFNTKQFELIKLVTSFDEAVSVLKQHNITLSKHNVEQIYKNASNSTFIQLLKL
jgi:hypothetical protein